MRGRKKFQTSLLLQWQQEHPAVLVPVFYPAAYLVPYADPYLFAGPLPYHYAYHQVFPHAAPHPFLCLHPFSDPHAAPDPAPHASSAFPDPLLANDSDLDEAIGQLIPRDQNQHPEEDVFPSPIENIRPLSTEESSLSSSSPEDQELPSPSGLSSPERRPREEKDREAAKVPRCSDDSGLD